MYCLQSYNLIYNIHIYIYNNYTFTYIYIYENITNVINTIIDCRLLKKLIIRKSYYSSSTLFLSKIDLKSCSI